MYNDNVLTNPFPGLRAFEEEEDILFFGREKQIDELLRKLRTSRFLAIIGSSGSGKSSLVKSGLLPSLHSGLMSGAGSAWRIALFRPGNDPISNLNEALSKNGVLRNDQTQEELETNSSINESILRRSSLGLIETYKQSGLDKKNNLLVLVDQFEELFRFSKYEKDAGEGKRDSIAFINMLLKAAEQKEFPIYVVFTMRSDFLGDCTEFRGLPEAINEGQYLIPRMTREERREAITGPIAVGGATISPALLNRLLNDVGDNPDQLPLLQHALMRTWDAWTKKKNIDLPIEIDDYEHIGTITEAISQHAEEAYAELANDKERQICEKVFKELTDKGGMMHGIRRPRLLSELSAAADATDEEVIKIVEIFRKPGRGFLMPAYPTQLTSTSIIDISHESLMRVWKRLITWLEEEEESAQVYLHLCDAVNLYETGKGGLWRDPELQIALKWKAEQNTNAVWAARYNSFYDKAIFFLEHSKQKRDLEIKHKEELQKQRLRITRRISVVVSVIALIAFLFGIYAFSQQIEATKAKKLAEDQKNGALLQKQIALNNRKAALEAKKVAEAAKDSAEKSKLVAIAQEKNAVKQQGIAQMESRNARMEKENALRSAHEAEESKKIAQESEKSAIKSQQEAELSKLRAITEKEKAERLRKLAESKNEAHKATMYMNDSDFQNCLKLSLSAYNNNQANEGDFQDEDIYSALYLSWQNQVKNKNYFLNHSAPVRSLTGFANSDFVFSGDENGKIISSSNIGGLLTKKAETSVRGEIRSLATDPTGNWLLAVTVKEATLFKINADGSLQKLFVSKLTGNGRHGAFLNNKYFLVQNTDGIIRYEIGPQAIKKDSVRIPECATLLVGSNGKIYVGAVRSIFEYAGWESITAAPAKTYTLPSHVTSLCLDKANHYLAAGTYGGGIWLKDLTSNQAPYNSSLHKSAVNDVKFCNVMDGKLLLASASSDKTIKLLEVTSAHNINIDNLITISTDHTDWVYSLLFSRDGKYLFSGSEDQQVIGRPTTMKYIYNSLTNK
ncbi:MAG: repeat, subgroup [Flavipsychrobacter sp.]|nr:repeat, subgroup [Flavipsychrobacter sp.]